MLLIDRWGDELGQRRAFWKLVRAARIAAKSKATVFPQWEPIDRVPSKDFLHGYRLGHLDSFLESFQEGEAV